MAREQRGNLPLGEPTSFVGRKQELALVKRRLETHRAVTVTGPSGIGKSRLALRAGNELARAFADGAWWVDLTTVDEGTNLAAAIGAAPRVDQDDRSPETRLAGHLRSLHLLLVLDGYDRLLPECVDLVDRLIRFAPELKVLCTGRRALHALGETVLPLPPMALPPAVRADASAPAISAATARDSDSVRLFCERAVTAHPPFLLSADNTAAVVTICRELDGVPAALELAAERASVLSADQIADRLGDAFSLLTGRADERPGRRTLLSFVQPIAEASSVAERTLWSRLSVFEGPFELSAAEAVCATDALDGQSLLDLCASMVEKSVLLREDRPGGPWFRLPRLLRRYAHTFLLAPTESGRLRHRHARWAFRLADQAGRGMLTPRSATWLACLRGYHLDLVGAVEFLLTAGERPAEGLVLAASLEHLWLLDGRVSQGRSLLDRGLDALPPAPSDTAPAAHPEARARGLITAAHLALVDRAQSAAEAYLAEAAEIARTVQAPLVHGRLLFVRAVLDMERNDLDTALDRLTAAQALLRDHRLVVESSRVLWQLGALGLLRDEPLMTLRSVDEFLDTAEVSGENWGLTFVHWIVALIHLRRGDHDAALAALHRCATLVRRLDDRFGMAACLFTAPLVLAAVGRYEEAATLLGVEQRFPLYSLPQWSRELGRCAETVRSRLGRPVADAAMQSGSALSAQEAIDMIADRESAPTGQSAGPEGHGALSKREWEVADLLADGCSNKAIAAALVISTRTAEGHVRRILTKLDLSSRAQVAAWAARHRAARPRPAVRVGGVQRSGV